MTPQDPVVETLDAFARAAGFQKRRGSWFGGGEVTAAVSLQRSQYGRQHDLDVGFCLPGRPQPYPAHDGWDVRTRLEVLVPEIACVLAALLDLDRPMPDEARREALRRLLEHRLAPVLARGETLEGLRAMMRDGTLDAAGVRDPYALA